MPETILRIQAGAEEYLGWPILAMNVNGYEVGRVTVSAAAMMPYTFTVTTALKDIKTVQILYVNDQYAGDGMDRNLNVNRLSIDNVDYGLGVPNGMFNTNIQLRTGGGSLTWEIKK